MNVDVSLVAAQPSRGCSRIVDAPKEVVAANLAFYVGRILKGTTPVDPAMKFDLVINLATAKAIDLDIPPKLTRRELPPCSAGRRPPGLPGDRSASVKMVLLKLSW